MHWQNIFKACLVALATFLPWQGLISVLLPEVFRFWKEGILLVLILTLVMAQGSDLNSFFARFKTSKVYVLSFLFLCWGLFLICINPDKSTTLTAFRYLGLGYLVFLVVGLLLENISKKDTKKYLKTFVTYFVGSASLSVLFGFWAQFGGGYDILGNLYSMTISSWVPGQGIPIYHQTSEGLVRMQGGASGPVAFGHLLVLALWANLFVIKPKIWLYYRLSFLVTVLLLAGIYYSASRGALLGGSFLLSIFFVQYIVKTFSYLASGKQGLMKKISRVLRRGFFMRRIWIILLALLGLNQMTDIDILEKLPKINQITEMRISDSDHLTRPLEALEIWKTAPVLGNLGELGPAARAKNLNENNNDQAPIAENVWIDYLAQLGLFGFLLALGVWGLVFWETRFRTKVLLVIFLGLTQLATLFDMTPVSLAFFTLLALSFRGDKIKFSIKH